MYACIYRYARTIVICEVPLQVHESYNKHNYDILAIHSQAIRSWLYYVHI